MDALAAAVAAVEGTPMQQEVLPPIQGRVLHVDGDYLAYWTGVIEDAGTAKMVAINKIEKMQQLSRAERSVVHLTDDASSKGDRRIIAEARPYQAQRSGKGKPINWAFMRQVLSSLRFGPITSKVWGTREADDGMAYCAYLGDKPIAIAAKDKDMRMLPGVHINWDDFSLTEVPRGAYDVIGADGKQYGLKWFWLQCLHGDTADHIPGLPKYINAKGTAVACGEAAAAKLLAPATCSHEAGQIVAQHYEMYYGDGWQRKLVEQMLLLWLRTDRDASIFDLRQVLPLDNDDELWYFDTKIKEAYAQAQSLGSSGVPCQDDGGASRAL